MMEQIDFLKMQSLSRYVYHVSISRVQTRWQMQKSLYALSFIKHPFRTLMLKLGEKEWVRIPDSDIDMTLVENTIVVGQSILVFSGKRPVNICQCQFNLHSYRVIRKELDDLPFYQHHEAFSLTAIRDRQVLMTGGSNQDGLIPSSKVFLLNSRSGKWVTEPRQPSLNVARYWHASCATTSAVFVFGGCDADCKDLDILERLSLRAERERSGRFKQPCWVQFNLPNLVPLSSPLMVAQKNNSILIIGGWRTGQPWQT